ncbi:hypothetical protein P0F65_06520 [Sphingomonas sp. I4]
MLLNGRRIAGFADIQALPYEAMEKVEVLPEQEAARFGYPPTVRVLNFITKKKFRAVTVNVLPGLATDGGGQTNMAEVTSARIDGPRRLTFSASHFRQNPVLQSQRAIAPDPDVLYATTGNVTGVNGAALDPRLDALAGRTVTMAGCRAIRPRAGCSAPMRTARPGSPIWAPIVRSSNGPTPSMPRRDWPRR